MICRASWGCMPLKAIHRPNASVVRLDSSALWRGRSARCLVRGISTMASTTNQVLRGHDCCGWWCGGDYVCQGVQFAVGGRPEDDGPGVVLHAEAG